MAPVFGLQPTFRIPRFGIHEMRRPRFQPVPQRKNSRQSASARNGGQLLKPTWLMPSKTEKLYAGVLSKQSKLLRMR